MTRVALLLICLFAAAISSTAAEHKTLYVQVILGCDKDKPSSSSYQEIGPKLSAKLARLFRWKHFWETERKKVEFNPAKVTKVPLANQRTLEIERLRSGELEIRLLRRSGLVTKARQPGKGGMAILGGEESSKDSFFVVIRSDEPVNHE